MAKFDHKRNLPYIFKENDLSIMPISRSEYVIGEFNVFQKVKYNIKSPQIVDTPSHLTTIDPTNLYSESSALHCASVSGMINNLLGEEAEQTVSRSEEHTSELQSRGHLVCRLLLEKKKIQM